MNSTATRISFILMALAIILLAAAAGFLYVELDRTQASLQETEAQLQQESATLAATEVTLEGTQATLVSTEGTLEATQVTLASTEGTLEATQATLASTEGTLEATQATLASTEGTLEATQATLASTKGTLEATQVTLASTKGTLEATQVKLDAETQRSATLGRELRALQGLVGTKHSLEASITAAETERNRLREEITSLRSQVAIIPSPYKDEVACTGSMEPVITCLDRGHLPPNNR